MEKSVIVETVKRREKRRRYKFLDSVRGMVLISMILYHACWDLVYIFGKKWSWYGGTCAYIWQQSICWTFILLSGFCWSLGSRPAKRGLLVLLSGTVVSLATLLFMPENRVVFGVLTLIGSCMLLMIPLHKALRYIPAGAGVFTSGFLFFIVRDINEGYLGFENFHIIKLPDRLYSGMVMTFLGFPHPDFYSTDYFSLFPWIFLFLTGYFLYGAAAGACQEKFMEKYLMWEIKPLSFLGRHSLIIYMLHQPVIYGVFTLLRSLEK